MTPAELEDGIDKLRTDKAHGASTPHKAALLRWVIARIAEGHAKALRFREIDEPLGAFLASPVGVGRRSDSSMPFWHLRSDSLWEADDRGLELRTDGRRPLRSATVAADPVGRLPAGVFELLRGDGGLRRRLTKKLLEQTWGSRDYAKVVAALRLEKR